MRQHKYRVWDKQQNKFHTDRDWGLSLDGTHIIGFSSHDSWDHDKGSKIKITKSLVVQQYTGLKDKNNVEIYEGDILDCGYVDNNVIDQVKYSNEFAAFLVGDNALWQGWLEKAKVIGNIFENPELLK